MAEGPDVGELAAALYDGVGIVARRLRQAQSPGELTLPERSALSRLARGGPASASELARAEQITPQAMGTTLSGLQERGYVERRPDPHDGRRIIMSLTVAGVEVLRQKRDDRARRLAQALEERFSGPELATLRAAVPLLERLGESL
jgi:DNA-binding MarR family transcriptional regulator